MSEKYFRFNVIEDDFDFTPRKANPTDSGFDCFAYLPKEKEIVLKPVKRDFSESWLGDQLNHVFIPLGFSINVLKQFEQQIGTYKNYNNLKSFIPLLEDTHIGVNSTCGVNIYTSQRFNIGFQLRSRSGLALKHNLQCHVGTIDTTYGEMVSATIFNLSNKDYVIKHGDKICQICVELIPDLNHSVNKVKTLEELNKNSKRSGWGSSDAK